MNGRRGAATIIPGLSGLFSYLYFAMLSGLLTDSALPGTVICASLQGARRLLGFLRREGADRRERAAQGAAAVLLAAFAVSAGMHSGAWVLVVLACLVLLRSEACRLARARTLMAAAVTLACFEVAMLALLVPRVPLHPLLIGLGVAAELLLALLSPEPSSTGRSAQTAELAEMLRQTHAGRTFLRLVIAFSAAGEMVRALIWRAAMLPAGTLAVSLLVLCCGVYAAWALLDITERRRARMSDPTNMLILGLLVWLLGLVSYGGSGTAALIIGMGLTGAGCCLCSRASIRLLDGMRNVANFMQEQETDGVTLIAAAAGELGMLAGSLLTGAVMTGVLLFGAQSAVTVAMAVLLIVCLWTVLCFPLSKRLLDKLALYLIRRDAGAEQNSLRKLLHSRIVERRGQPFLVNFLIPLVRVFFHHRVEGLENVRPDDDNPLVYLCNHGDMYGPVAAMAFIPGFKRPWSISTICVDAKEAADYVYKYDWSQMTWLHPKLQRLMADLMGRFAVWATGSQLDSVPVFRDKPGQLIRTFRASVEALECGDSMLIFPENPNAVAQDHGYETSGVGTLFSGFAMLAQIYYSKTGKRCRFMPLFAHQASRTVAFGTEIVYDPDNDAADERQRIADETSAQMNALCDRLDAAMEKRK